MHHIAGITAIFIGIAVLLFSANLIVVVAKTLAGEIGIPVFLVGLFLLSVGTTLPELAFSVRSLEDGQPTMFLGNILGSIIVNSTLIVGTVALLSPVVDFVAVEYELALFTFVFVYVLFWMFTKTKLSLSRWEAGGLFLIYLIFIVLEFVK